MFRKSCFTAQFQMAFCGCLERYAKFLLTQMELFIPETYSVSNLGLFPNSKTVFAQSETEFQYFSSWLLYKEFQTVENRFLPGFSTACSKIPKEFNYQSLIFQKFLI